MLVIDEADSQLLNTDKTALGILKAFRNAGAQALLFSASFPERAVRLMEKEYPSTGVNRDNKPVGGFSSYAKIMYPDADSIPSTLKIINMDVRRLSAEDESEAVRLKDELRLDELAARKLQTLKSIYKLLADFASTCIIFCDSQRDVETVTALLRKDGYDFGFIHGQSADRMKVMEDFKAGNFSFLVTTELLAKGFDEKNMGLVVNYFVPMVYKQDRSAEKEADPITFQHKIGRAGRAGNKGIAISFIGSEEDARFLRDIAAYHKIEHRIQDMHQSQLYELKAELDEWGKRREKPLAPVVEIADEPADGADGAGTTSSVAVGSTPVETVLTAAVAAADAATTVTPSIIDETTDALNAATL